MRHVPCRRRSCRLCVINFCKAETLSTASKCFRILLGIQSHLYVVLQAKFLAFYSLFLLFHFLKNRNNVVNKNTFSIRCWTMYKVHDFKVLVYVLNEVHTSSFSLSMNGNLFCRKYVHHEKMTHFYRIPNTSFVILKESSSKSKESFYYKLDGNSYMLVFSCTHT